MAIPRFRPLPKLLSWLLLHAAGVPALRGIVVTDWDVPAGEDVAAFAAEWSPPAVLIRSDSPAETGLSPRGGYVVPASDVEREVQDLLDQGRVPFLLEPASPLEDLYSLNLQPDASWREWSLEIVGPGFDASDLKRGDVTPHESIDLRLDGSEIRLDRRDVAHQDLWDETVQIRRAKVALMLGCPHGELEERLRALGLGLLVETSAYPVMPEHLVEHAIRTATRLRPALERYGLSTDRTVVSMSFVTRQARLVAWDVVWPATKYLMGHAAESND